MGFLCSFLPSVVNPSRPRATRQAGCGSCQGAEEQGRVTRRYPTNGKHGLPSSETGTSVRLPHPQHLHFMPGTLPGVWFSLTNPSLVTSQTNSSFRLVHLAQHPPFQSCDLKFPNTVTGGSGTGAAPRRHGPLRPPALQLTPTLK